MRALRLLLMVCVFSLSALAQENATNAHLELLDRMTGDWVLDGTIAGKHTVHDVHATWVLNREYIEIHEISREQKASGGPAYEAIVYISWDDKAQQYVCLWLDNTAGGGLSAQGLAHAQPAGDSIPFLFLLPSSEQIRTTFTFNRQSRSWRWTIDEISQGKTERFADVQLTRGK